eukprot:TRINITY_DN2652_c0_g1_i8.p1 TRINITY_DN2652_c0_g1~~TRINITY_DN2652_c0_g1_i8.p1  ORF type:complete len:213 (+),score=57.02 TRINITY_DN2652_c0_g1_i8:103-741(+)
MSGMQQRKTLASGEVPNLRQSAKQRQSISKSKDAFSNAQAIAALRAQQQLQQQAYQEEARASQLEDFQDAPTEPQMQQQVGRSRSQSLPQGPCLQKSGMQQRKTLASGEVPYLRQSAEQRQSMARSNNDLRNAELMAALQAQQQQLQEQTYQEEDLVSHIEDCQEALTEQQMQEQVGRSRSHLAVRASLRGHACRRVACSRGRLWHQVKCHI